MNYQNYIDLGFTRIDMNDAVELKRTGYSGFALEKKITHTTLLCVSSGDLNQPKLYIKKSSDESYHIIPLTPEMVKDMLTVNNPNFSTGC